MTAFKDSTGNIVQAELDEGSVPVINRGLGSGENPGANAQQIVDGPYEATYISTATTTLVQNGAGILKRIVITETAAAIITIYDGLDANGVVKAVLKASIAEQPFDLDIEVAEGITIVTAGASKLTAIHKAYSAS